MLFLFNLCDFSLFLSISPPLFWQGKRRREKLWRASKTLASAAMVWVLRVVVAVTAAVMVVVPALAAHRILHGPCGRQHGGRCEVTGRIAPLQLSNNKRSCKGLPTQEVKLHSSLASNCSDSGLCSWSNLFAFFFVLFCFVFLGCVCLCVCICGVGGWAGDVGGGVGGWKCFWGGVWL